MAAARKAGDPAAINKLAGAALALLAGACMPSAPPLLSYGASGVAMIANAPSGTKGSTGGKLERRGHCLVVDTPGGVILPLWPPGTRIAADKLLIPNLGWRRPLEIGGFVGLEGRYLFAHDGSLQRVAGAGAAACASRGFIVERARRIFIAGNAVELAAESEAVLLLRIDRTDFSDSRSDGHRTTMEATVLEAFKGPYRAGQTVRVRHVQGEDASGEWNLTAHSMHFPQHQAGDQVLLFVNRELYFGQAEARGGQPLPGHVGAGGGLFRVSGDRIINDADIRMPDTLDELRAQLRRR